MKIRTHSICKLVKSEDLNHHGTLFAGKTAMWFVESGFVAAAGYVNPEHIVCLKIHGMLFKKPVNNGQVVRFDSKVVLAGRTTLMSYVRVVDNNSEAFYLDGFIQFVYVDSSGRAVPHGIEVNVADSEDISLQEKAKALL
jgi:acyl-CoA hydrolase